MWSLTSSAFFLPYLTLPRLASPSPSPLPYLTSLYSTVFVVFLYAAQPAGTGNTGSAPAPAGEGQPGNQPGNPPGGGEMGTSYIQVTPEERQAIERVRDWNCFKKLKVSRWIEIVVWTNSTKTFLILFVLSFFS